jgi:aryl-phospho-beta-D-glucosidase BglC (GH1 family)
MNWCPSCQGPVDQATGICQQCGRVAQDNLVHTQTAVQLDQISSEGSCPTCGEATIANQRFCRRCGQALTITSSLPEDLSPTLYVGEDWSEAEALLSTPYTPQSASYQHDPWSESPTLPAIQSSVATSTRPSASRRRYLRWLPLLLILVAATSGLSGYLLIHAQSRASDRASSVSATTPAPGATATSGLNASPTTAPNQPVGAGYWHTNGSQILDANNQPVRIAGINWFGFESESYVVHGLGQRDYHDLLKQVKDLGYNTVRLPFSDQLFFTNSVPNGISFANGMNQDLQGLNGLQILDKIVAAAGQLGLKIILDHHGVDAGAQVALWSSQDCSVSCFESDWQMLATHYNGNTTIIGADLDNEPHSPACWGCGDPALDWQMEAQKLGNEVLAINPNWLIFVEGVECYNNDCYWWGGNLEGVADKPVQLKVPNRVVYSPHDYPHDVYNLHYFSAPDYPDNLPGIWDAHWGFIAKQHIAPVWLGEFGTQLADQSDQQWLSSLVKYLGTGVTGISWTYWALNPDSGDTGGILQNDWSTVNQKKQDYLNPIEFPLGGGNSNPTGAGTPTPTPSATATRAAVNNFQVTPTAVNQACSNAQDTLSPFSVTLDNSASTVAVDWEIHITDTDPAGNIWATVSNVSGTTLPGQTDTVTITPFVNKTTTLCADMQAAPAPMAYSAIVVTAHQSVPIKDTVTPPARG